MEPLKPDVKKQLLLNAPQASPQDVGEYERLLSERFTVDPSLPAARTTTNPNFMAAPNALSPPQEREARLRVLHQKLFHPLDVVILAGAAKEGDRVALSIRTIHDGLPDLSLRFLTAVWHSISEEVARDSLAVTFLQRLLKAS